MSGRLSPLDTLTKVKSAAGQQFLSIMGSSSQAVQSKKEKKAAKEQLGKAMKALSPWYDEGNLVKSGKSRTIGELGWLLDEHDQFTADMQAVEASRKSGDYQRALDQAGKAKQHADGYDEAKTTRAAAEVEIEAVRTVISKISNPTALRTEISTKLGLEAEALRRGDPPDALLLRVRALKTDAEGLATGAGSAPGKSKLEEKRDAFISVLRPAVDAEDEKIRKLAIQALPETDGIIRDMDASALFGLRVAEIRGAVNPGQEEAGLPTEEARIALLQKKFDQAMADLPKVVKDFTAELQKNKGKDFVQGLQSKAGQQLKAQALAAAKDQFIADYAQVETELAGLADILAPAPAELATAVAAAKQKIIDKAQYDKAASTIAIMLKHIGIARDGAVAAAAKGAGTLSTDLAALRTDVAKAAKAADKRTRDAFKALSLELDQLDVIVKTNNVAAFAAAGQRVAAIRAAGVTAAPAITRFNETVDAIEAVTANKAVAKEFASGTNEIRLAVGTVVAALSLFELADAQRTLNALKRDADALLRRTEALGPWRTDMEGQLKVLSRMIDAFHKLMPGTDDTTFIVNYKEALDAYKKPGVDVAATTKLVTEATALAYPVINNLQQAGTGQARTINVLEADRVVGQANIAEKAEKERLIKEKHDTLKTGLEKYEADIKVAAKAVNAEANGDKDELKELTLLGEQARKKFQNKDEEGAAAQLKSIRKRLNALLTTPGGVVAESVAALADVEKSWATAMAETHSLLGKIVSAANPAIAAARLRPADVEKRINGLYDQLQPFRSTLVRSMKMVGDPATPLKTRKSEREYALRDVRAMRAIIDGNPLAMKLAANPFGEAAPFTKLRRFLSDLEYNALRAVPPE